MYDTINFYHHDKVFDLSSLNQHLENVKRTIDEETGEWLFSQTKIGDFQFKFGMNWLSATGSLPRLIYPDNTFMLSREEVQKCIEMLSDKLHFDMNNINVTRIDVAATLEMKYPVKLYLDCLGELQNFKKCLSVKDETLYYMQENEKYLQKLIFYDKLCEFLKKHKVHPKGVKGVNLLRYEREWYKVLPAQLKEPEVKGRTLYDERFYHKIVELWAESYFAIAKRKALVDDAIGMIRTPKEGFYYIIAKALQMLPIDFVSKQIAAMQMYGIYPSSNSYSRLRGIFREIQSQANIMQEEELVNELNCKISNLLKT